ncbi:aminotransferase class V-fold PLP-dependent enzyme [Nocardia shimofusensis]|uniref:aminotransferase class V-fold PLP-dependent enzyme n=1 Tax=Nocardia shimofusensis TaxID=228596 RepID=UPI000831CCEF|nr:aminotransferase class V-fold PLP-dependent enzyme [Nocardia shimofusensis]
METSTPGSALSTGPRRSDVRDLFPALGTTDIYLDSAATTQKPRPVIETVTDYHRRATANAGRGSYPWSSRLATRITEIRAHTATFVGSAHPDEIVFTSGATAALNAVALCWALPELRDGDQILFNPLDHASNVLPWHHLRTLLARTGRRIDLVPYRTTPQGTADIDDIAAATGPRTRLVTVAHLHHVYGGLTDVARLRASLPPETLLCVDCSQSGGHVPVDVRTLGADFAVFAAHKMFGTPGTGVLYCARRVHDRLLPFLPGGDTGVRLTAAGLESTGMPRLLEGGTPNIPGILALGSALEVLDSLDRRVIAEHNRGLTRRVVDRLRPIRGIRFLPGPAHTVTGTISPGYGIVSFTLDGIGSQDLGFVLAEHGFLVRTGAHCVRPPEPDAAGDSVRVSTQIYTTVEEVDRFTACVASIAEEIT